MCIRDSIGIYNASKWALEAFSQSLAQEVADFGIKVTLIEPGGFSTDWGGASARHAQPNPAYDAYREKAAEQRKARVPHRATRRPAAPPSWQSSTRRTRRCGSSSGTARWASPPATTSPGWPSGASGSTSPGPPRAERPRGIGTYTCVPEPGMHV